MTDYLGSLESATALLDRHPAPAVQIRGLPQLAADEADEDADADAPCDARHFAPRWWPAPEAE